MGLSNMDEIRQLIKPSRLWSRAEVVARPCPVPAKSGTYAWYFRQLPGCVDARECLRYNDLTLLYVGISPKAPLKDGKSPSKETLRSRIRYHFTGNAEGSTLRLTLGCLLAESLGIELRRVGSGHRMTFSVGEKAISEWMGQNAYVTWVESLEPWNLEQLAIRSLPLPLNIDQNGHCSFCETLRRIRSTARMRAKLLDVLVR